MDEYGPSLEDIRKCTHREKNPQKRQERECKCEPGEIGWTLYSGPHYRTHGYIRTENGFMKKVKTMQTKLVHTRKWENKKWLKEKYGEKSRSSLRISPKIFEIYDSWTGPKKRGGRGKERRFAEGLPARGKAHFLRRQIFVLLHENPHYIDYLLNTYSSNVEERSRIDEILLNNGKREKVKVSVNMPILEKAYDDFIGLISKECKGKLTEKEKRISLENHILLKNNTKWRFNLCRLIELRVIDIQRKKDERRQGRLIP